MRTFIPHLWTDRTIITSRAADQSLFFPGIWVRHWLAFAPGCHILLAMHKEVPDA